MGAWPEVHTDKVRGKGPSFGDADKQEEESLETFGLIINYLRRRTIGFVVSPLRPRTGVVRVPSELEWRISSVYIKPCNGPGR